MQVLWYINGHPVAADATHKMLVNEAGNNALMITGCSQRDAGTVTCVARNKSGEISHQVRQARVSSFSHRVLVVNTRNTE